MHPRDWYQQSLTPPEVVEVRIRLGFVPETDHVQAQVDVFDPVTMAQVACWSHPHAHMSQWGALLEAASAKARQYVNETLPPF